MAGAPGGAGGFGQQQLHAIPVQQQHNMSSITLETATLNCEDINLHLNEGECMDLETFLAPIAGAESEDFFPKSIYIRKEMCEVLKELTKKDRKRKQILIGSPGVGKSVLLFLVALYRALYDNKPCCFVRKTRNSEELTSVFFLHKAADKENAITIHYSRKVDPDDKVKDVLKHVLQAKMGINPAEALSSVVRDEVLLCMDGPHKGDDDLRIPHHYLATSGGYDTPQGESAKTATLVVLGGWQKLVLGKALKATSSILTEKIGKLVGEMDGQQEQEMDTVGEGQQPANSDDPGQEQGKTDPNEGGDSEEEPSGTVGTNFSEEEALEDIFYHTGGRIREAFEYAKNPRVWKSERKAMIDSISKEQAMLSIVKTKGSGDEKSPDRVRTMFRNEEGPFFGSALQIVDSQYYARLLQDRVGLEDYYNAYIHAKKRGLSSAAGCHFEELLHQLFHKCPNPITSLLQSIGKGSEGIAQFKAFSCYWIPSIPNFANIDAALVIKDSGGNVTVWCLQYTVSKEHKFNPRTFVTKFLRPLLQNFGLQRSEVAVNVVFVVPDDIFTEFKVPEDVDDAGYTGSATFADCSNGVDAVQGIFEKLAFIDQPVTFPGAPNPAQRARH